jgi:hypothetical protein
MFQKLDLEPFRMYMFCKGCQDLAWQYLPL